MEGFLAGLGQVGQAAGGVAAIGNLFGVGKDRPSWRDMQFMMDTSERLAPRDIALQGQYLEGLAPAQAGAYNTYQRETYGEDTQRQIDRIQSTGQALGMSPWEIMGQGGAAPLPSPAYGGASQGASKGDYMAQLVPLEIAKMNNKTQLATAAMSMAQNKYAIDKQTGTQVQTTQMSNENALAITNIQTANGRKPFAELKQTEAQTLLTAAQTLATEESKNLTIDQQSFTQAQTMNVHNQALVSLIGVIAPLLPEFNYNLGPVTIKQRGPWGELAKIAQQYSTGTENNTNAIRSALGRMDSGTLNSLNAEAIALANWMLPQVRAAGQAGQDAFGGINKFLKDMVQGAQDAGMPQDTLDRRIPKP